MSDDAFRDLLVAAEEVHDAVDRVRIRLPTVLVGLISTLERPRQKSLGRDTGPRLTVPLGCPLATPDSEEALTALAHVPVARRGGGSAR